MKIQNSLKILICLWLVGLWGMVPVYGAADYKTCVNLCRNCPTDGASCTSPSCARCLKECPGWQGHCNPIPLNQTLCSQACGSQSSYAGCSSCFASNASCQAQNITMNNIPSSGFAGCFSIAKQFNSCQAACNAKNCSECLAPTCTALGAPFTSNPGYMACSNCKTACESSNCTDCATSTCQALGSFITSIPAYTACAQCITACNAKNCSECLAPACTALGSSITSNPGYVGCAACTSACAGASGASCPPCFNTCQSNGITSSMAGAPSSLAPCKIYNNAISSCATACEGAPIIGTVSTDPSWEKCPQCMNACQAQNTPLPASNVCPQSLNYCDAGCASAVNDMTGQQCGTCLSSFACQLGGVQVTPGVGSIQTSFNFSSINNGASYVSINKCNTIFNNIKNCYDAIVAANNNASQCNSVITNNSSCQALGIRSNNLSGFSWLSNCATAIANANAATQAACTSACSKAPSSTQVSPSSTEWNQCPSCISQCNAAGMTGSNAPPAYSVCTSANATAACAAGCSGASNDPSGRTCTNCLSYPACSFAGINSGNISTGSSGGLGACATLYENINTCVQSCAAGGQQVEQAIQQGNASPGDICINNNTCMANTACQQLGVNQNNIATFAGYGGAWSNLSTCANMQTCTTNCSNATTQNSLTAAGAACANKCFGSAACQQIGINVSSPISTTSNGTVFAACANLIKETQTECQQQCNIASTNPNSSTCGYCLSNYCSSSGILGTSGYQNCFNWWNTCGSGAGVSLDNPSNQSQSQVSQILSLCSPPGASGSGSPLATCVKACNPLFNNYNALNALYENAVICVNNCSNVPSSLVGNYPIAQQIVQALQALVDGSITQNFYGPCNAAYNTLKPLIGGQDPITTGAMPAVCTNRTSVPSACAGACSALSSTQMVTGNPLSSQDVYVITTCGQSFCEGMVNSININGLNIGWQNFFPNLVDCLQAPTNCSSCCQALSQLARYGFNHSPTFNNFCSQSTCQQMGY